MLTIAICDDDKKTCNTIEILIKEYESQMKYACRIYCFSNASELLDQRNRFDVYLLDILMPGLNGIELASTLRKSGDKADIIFLTSAPEFALESYSVQALNYLLKPINKEQLFSTLDRAFYIHQKRKNNGIVIRSKGKLISILIDDIEFVEARLDKVVFCLSNGVILESTNSLFSFEERLLAAPEFVKPHRAYLVNMSKIKELSGRDIHVSDCYPSIPIARGHFAQVKEAYLSYMTLQMNRGEQK